MIKKILDYFGGTRPQTETHHRPTKLVYNFQQSRAVPPYDAIQTTVSKWQSSEISNRDQVECPRCGRINTMTHGDRILCGCDTMIEIYGNGLVHWDPKLRSIKRSEYDWLDPETLCPSVSDMLTRDPEIRVLYESSPAIRDGVEELATLIKLHEGIDKDG